RSFSERLVPAPVSPVLGYIHNCVLVRARAGIQGHRSNDPVLCGECGLGNLRAGADATRISACAMCASLMIPRAVSRAGSLSHAWCWRICLATRCLWMESSHPRTATRVHWHEGQLKLAGTVGAGCCCLSRNLLCHPRAIGRIRTVHQAPVERRTVDAFAGCSGSPVSSPATACHHAPTPAPAREDGFF